MIYISIPSLPSPANQDTIVELIGFFQSALPSNLLPQLGGHIRQLELKSHKDKKKRRKKEVSDNQNRVGCVADHI